MSAHRPAFALIRPVVSAQTHPEVVTSNSQNRGDGFQSEGGEEAGPTASFSVESVSKVVSCSLSSLKQPH